MSRVEDLVNEIKELPAYRWQDFNRLRKKHVKKGKFFLYCIYEGKDDSKYYNHRLDNMGLSNWHHFECGGKSNLLGLRNKLKIHNSDESNIYKISSIYFIDKDFDEYLNVLDHNKWLKEKDIYVTPCYSIENCLSNREVIEKILKCEFNIDETKSEYKLILKEYKKLEKKFREIMIEWNSWIIAYQYYFNKKEIIEKLPLNELTLKKMLIISLNDIIIKKKISDFFKEKSILLPSGFFNQVSLYKSNLTKKSNCQYRGKFELDFLYKFIQLINDETTKYKKMQLHIHEKNFLTQVSKYGRTPKRLKKFVKSIKK